MSEFTRSMQTPETLYLCPDGTCYFTPDGEGRFWYDSEDDALNQHSPKKVVVLDVMPEEF